jgi:hypothetical protein
MAHMLSIPLTGVLHKANQKQVQKVKTNYVFFQVYMLPTQIGFDSVKNSKTKISFFFGHIKT